LSDGGCAGFSAVATAQKAQVADRAGGVACKVLDDRPRRREDAARMLALRRNLNGRRRMHPQSRFARASRASSAATRCSAERSPGFTLLELMITLSVLAILASLGVPAMQEMLERNRLKGAAQALAEDLQWVRGEAIRRNRICI
jgi:prepilin-type N-terminal cleavage/methylation domain-containing protein